MAKSPANCQSLPDLTTPSIPAVRMFPATVLGGGQPKTDPVFWDACEPQRRKNLHPSGGVKLSSVLARTSMLETAVIHHTLPFFSRNLREKKKKHLPFRVIFDLNKADLKWVPHSLLHQIIIQVVMKGRKLSSWSFWVVFLSSWVSEHVLQRISKNHQKFNAKFPSSKSVFFICFQKNCMLHPKKEFGDNDIVSKLMSLSSAWERRFVTKGPGTHGKALEILIPERMTVKGTALGTKASIWIDVGW